MKREELLMAITTENVPMSLDSIHTLASAMRTDLLELRGIVQRVLNITQYDPVPEALPADGSFMDHICDTLMDGQRILAEITEGTKTIIGVPAL